MRPLAVFTTTFAVAVAMEVVQVADAALEVANVAMRIAARATAVEHVAAMLPASSGTWVASADCVAAKGPARVAAELAVKPAPSAGNKAGSTTARTCSPGYSVTKQREH